MTKAPWDKKNSSDLTSIFDGGFVAQPIKLQTSANPESDFCDALQNAGLNLGSFVPDGSIHRISDATDKPGKKSAYYCYFPDPDCPGGFFGSFKSDFYQTWSAKSDNSMSAQEQENFRRRIEATKKERERIQRQLNDDAAIEAASLYEKATTVSNHPYLQQKQIGLHVARQSPNGELLIPAYNENNEIRSLQLIYQDGKKRFLSGSSTKGCFCVLGKASENEKDIYLTEGYSTAATIHEILGRVVFAAFSAGNLMPVAEVIRKHFPDTTIHICADNDQYGNKNTGLMAAQKVTQAISGTRVYVPYFADTAAKPTDFNDLYLLAGSDAVKKQLAVSGSMNLFSFAGLMDDPPDKPETFWGEDPVLFRGARVLIAGQPKIGKSNLTLGLLIAAATGGNFLGEQFNRPYKVLWLQAEIHQAFLYQRVQRSIRGLGKEQTALLRANLYMSGRIRKDLMNNSDLTEVIQNIEDIQPDIIAIDPVINFSTAEENANTEVFSLLGKVDQIAEKFNCATVLVHHVRKAAETPKDPFTLIRGATAFRGWYDSGIVLTGEPENIVTSYETRNCKSPSSHVAVFDHDASIWTRLMIDEQDNQSDKTKEHIKEAKDILLRAAGWITATHLKHTIINELNLKERQTHNLLKALREHPSISTKQDEKDARITLYCHKRNESESA